MGSIKDKASYLLNTKIALRNALIIAGIAVPEDLPLRQYVEKINALRNTVDEAASEGVFSGMQLINFMNIARYGGSLKDIPVLSELVTDYNNLLPLINLHVPMEDNNA